MPAIITPENPPPSFIFGETGLTWANLSAWGITAVGIPYASVNGTIVAVSDGTTSSTFWTVGVERLQGDNASYALDVRGEGDAGFLYRLYQTAFDRAPDTDGFSFNLHNLDDAALSRVGLVNDFLTSPEFVGSGITSNEELVTALYEHALDREADAAGLLFWTEALDSGAISRADVVIAFADSAELRENTKEALGYGVEINPAFFPYL